MALFVRDLQQYYRQVFGGRPYVINGQKEDITQVSGSALTADYLGKEIWLPVKFIGLNSDTFGVSELLLPYSVIKISSSKTIVKTQLSERRGSVKELFGIDDFQISIKGFVIDDTNRTWPEDELIVLKKLNELSEAIQLDNALTNIFLDNDTRVVIDKLDLPEVEGGSKHIRPFSMNILSDSIFTLEVE